MGLDGLLSGQDLIENNYCAKYVPPKGLKEFCPNNSWLEKKQIENQLENKFNFIKANNIERENNISHAQWIPHLNKAKVTKKVGKFWSSLGHHQENEDWLLPEEALFLVENSELLLFCDDVPVSIEDCYKLIIDEGCISWEEFRVFSHLSRAGFIVVRHSPSVSVTRYEQQVRLDSIIQNQKRLPPETSSDDVTIIDDDICIIEDTPSVKSVNNKIGQPKETEPQINKANLPSNESEENIVIIESDDEVREIDSDSDSDIICISSPSYVPDKNSREWYPSIQKVLKMTMEKIIDLCDEENYVIDNKYNIRNQIDLIRPSKAEILALVPSVVHNDSNYKFKPDKRLLPVNVVPKFAEYSFNLHITSDETDFNGYSDERMPFGPPVHQGGMNFSGPRNFNNMEMTHMMQNNPFLMKAQQMQTVAMNMMQSAQALMSVMTSAMQNPNELWDLVGNVHSSMLPFGPQRFGPPHNDYRPFGFPRKPRPFGGRFPRRRFPYDRRPWYGRRQYTPQRSIADRPASPEVSNDVVILSDEDDGNDDKKNVIIMPIESECNGKRKISPDPELCKRLKLESDSATTSLSGISVCPLGSSSENMKKEPADCSTKGNIKKESDKVIKGEPKERTGGTAESQMESSERFNNKVPIKQEENLVKLPSGISDKQNSSPRNDENLLSTHVGNVEKENTSDVHHAMDIENTPSNATRSCSPRTVPQPNLSPSRSNIPGPSSTETEAVPSSSKDSSDKTENSTKEISKIKESESSRESSGVVTNWEQYKKDVDDSMVTFDECVSLGDVLSALKIFKPIEVCRVNKKLKISYDLYLQEGRFKKSLKVLPDFRIIILKPTDELPTSVDIAGLKKQYQDSINFLFSIVFDDTIGFYLYDSITLTSLSM